MTMNRAAVGQNLVRTELWASELKEVLVDELMAQAYVNWLGDFPDGDNFTIPSIGEATIRDFTDDGDIIYDGLDTGEFGFTITEYKQSGTYITRKAQQDSFYAARLESSFVPKQNRALMESVETDTFAIGSSDTSVITQGAGQGASANPINGADHRLLATGSAPLGGNNRGVAYKDFAKVLFALKKANVSDKNLVGFVDPSVEYTLNTITPVVQGSNSPIDQSLAEALERSVASGTRFYRNIMGIDIYVTNYLPAAGTDSLGSETFTPTGGSSTTITNGIVNQFFSAADRELLPYLGAWRQLPIVDEGFNKDKQRFEYVTTSRYGLKLYRPENFVTMLSSTNVID